MGSLENQFVKLKSDLAPCLLHDLEIVTHPWPLIYTPKGVELPFQWIAVRTSKELILKLVSWTHYDHSFIFNSSTVCICLFICFIHLLPFLFLTLLPAARLLTSHGCCFVSTHTPHSQSRSGCKLKALDHSCVLIFHMQELFSTAVQHCSIGCLVLPDGTVTCCHIR